MSNQIEYKCPCCDGAIVFDSNIQKMKCPYCGSEFEMETLKQFDEDLKNTSADNMSWENVALGGEWSSDEMNSLGVLCCDACGGEVVGDKTMAASTCPYCGNNVVVKGALAGDLKPDYVIPFKLDKKAAIAGMSKHLKGKKLLPKVFKSQQHIDEVKGIYVPFWLFSADANANVRYKATKVHTWSDSNYNYTQTKYYSCYRAGSLSFDHVPEDGSSKMPDDLMESLEPFDFKDAVDFQTAYLSGYLADRYDVTEEECVGRANARIKKSTERAFANTVKGYSSVTPQDSNISLNNNTAKYALYPVWLLNTTWNGEKYTFAMNGQTGKFVGNLPMDKNAMFKWLFGTIGITAAIATAIQYIVWLI